MVEEEGYEHQPDRMIRLGPQPLGDTVQEKQGLFLLKMMPKHPAMYK